MMNRIRKYWWLIIFIFAIILMPKIIDWLFDIHSFSFTQLNHIHAEDVLNYAGGAVGGCAAVVSLIIALEQYKKLNQTYIVPIKKEFYFYADPAGKILPNVLSESSNIERENITQHKDDTLILQLRNLGKGTSKNYTINISYDSGMEYKELLKLLNVSDKIANFETDSFNNCGILNSNETINFQMPMKMKYMLQQICEAEFDNGQSADGSSLLNNNCLIGKKYKLGTIEISSEDILLINIVNNMASFKYDFFVEVDVTPHIFKTPVYSKIYLTYGESK